MTQRRGQASVVMSVIAAAAMLTAACSTGSTANSADQSEPGASAAQIENATALVEEHTGVPTFTPPGPAFDPSEARGKTVFTIPVSAAVPFNVYVNKYFTEAMKKFDIDVKYFSTTGETSQWVAGINAAIAQKAAAIVLIGMDPLAVAPQIADAKAAGIPVIVEHFLDTSHTDYEGYKDVAGVVGAPYNLAGQLTAAWAIKETQGKGTFLLVQSPDLLSSTDVAIGIEAEMARDCPSCNLVKVDVPFNAWSTRIQTAVSSALTRYPDTTYVLPVFDGMVQYVQPAITAAGKNDTVKVATYNATPFALGLLAEEDTVTMDVGESFSWLGYSIADQTLRLMTGQPPLEDEQVPVRVFSASNVSETGNPPEINTGYGDAYVAGYSELWGLTN